MKYTITLFLFVMSIIVSLNGCATPLTSIQKREYKEYQARGIALEEKKPVLGALLGLLPGIGSFYVGEFGPGVVNLLLWPASILWDPISGYEGSLSINYFATKQVVNSNMRKELKRLDEELFLKTVTNEDYIRQKRDIEARYSTES